LLRGQQHRFAHLAGVRVGAVDQAKTWPARQRRCTRWRGTRRSLR
jgi:hypothetical protein